MSQQVSARSMRFSCLTGCFFSEERDDQSHMSRSRQSDFLAGPSNSRHDQPFTCTISSDVCRPPGEYFVPQSFAHSNDNFVTITTASYKAQELTSEDNTMSTTSNLSSSGCQHAPPLPPNAQIALSSIPPPTNTTVKPPRPSEPGNLPYGTATTRVEGISLGALSSSCGSAMGIERPPSSNIFGRSQRPEGGNLTTSLSFSPRAAPLVGGVKRRQNSLPTDLSDSGTEGSLQQLFAQDITREIVEEGRFEAPPLPTPTPTTTDVKGSQCGRVV